LTDERSESEIGRTETSNPKSRNFKFDGGKVYVPCPI
jgi:hypothetical protein